MDGTGKNFDLSSSFNDAEKKPQPTAVELDLTAYVDMLSELDGSLEEKMQALHELARIVLGFVDLGFEVQFPQENCGKKDVPDCADSAQESTDVVNSNHTNKGGFEHER